MSDATLGFCRVYTGQQPVIRQFRQLNAPICRTHKHEGIFRAFAQFLRAINKAFARAFDNNFRQWSDICRAIIPVNMDKTGKWPDTLSTSRQQLSTGGVATPYFVRGHANGNTTQIRRYDDGSVLYFTLCLCVLCFLNEMGINWGFIVWWNSVAHSL